MYCKSRLPDIYTLSVMLFFKFIARRLFDKVAAIMQSLGLQGSGWG